MLWPFLSLWESKAEEYRRKADEAERSAEDARDLEAQLKWRAVDRASYPNKKCRSRLLCLDSRMPRYFFTGADIVAEDDEGEVFDDPIEARFAAESIARNLAELDPDGFKECSIQVRDESGALIATVTVSGESDHALTPYPHLQIDCLKSRFRSGLMILMVGTSRVRRKHPQIVVGVLRETDTSLVSHSPHFLNIRGKGGRVRYFFSSFACRALSTVIQWNEPRSVTTIKSSKPASISASSTVWRTSQTSIPWATKSG